MMLNNSGVYLWEHIRGGKILALGEIPNTVTIAGRNHMLNTEFRSGTQQASWFFGLVDNDAYDDNPDTDTMVDHPGWTELVDYDQATRPQWSPSAPVGGALTNAAPAAFTMSATNSVNGFFVASNSTKGGTAGILWSSVPFNTGPLTVEDGDEIRLTYTYGITSGA